MVRHIVCWDFKSGFSKEENRENALKIKKELESLKTQISGIVEIRAFVDLLATSNRNFVLNSLFESEQALADYQVHPEHKRIGSFINSVMENKVCLDFVD
jgi:hypothetical protein